MSNDQRNKIKLYALLASITMIFVMALSVTGCALGTTRLIVSHASLDQIENKKGGNILIRQFEDKRKETQYIGNKRNGFGMVLGHIGTEEGVNLAKLLTQYFADALREAGYKTTIQESNASELPSNIKFDAVLNGEILEFWMDNYMAVSGLM